MRTVVTLAVCATAWLVAQPARAQMWVGRAAPHTGSVEASGGALWSQGFDLGTSSAQLTRNPVTGTGPYDLFTADTHAGTVTGVQGRVGVYLSRYYSWAAAFPESEVGPRAADWVNSAADWIIDTFGESA